jgi:hypothetical protein
MAGPAVIYRNETFAMKTNDKIGMHNEELHDLYYSPDIIRAIKSMSVR